MGNDIVNIIYSEHSRDYNPSTITSQFNDAHIGWSPTHPPPFTTTNNRLPYGLFAHTTHTTHYTLHTTHCTLYTLHTRYYPHTCTTHTAHIHATTHTHTHYTHTHTHTHTTLHYTTLHYYTLHSHLLQLTTVVYPLRNGLFRIQIFKKNQVTSTPFFFH